MSQPRVIQPSEISLIQSRLFTLMETLTVVASAFPGVVLKPRR